ncbi:DoxX family protein [Chitinophaga sp. GbtcB8]|jgi:putative oxidoreductase|uniref:HvfX family Cu-binding RiPP maturation protein n=1 Tax=Chitinophaga sp. GbtcB8 TaxID=2824753 RepID=UPI001C2F32E0|nr:DoxX family protein [Chitinophaga sp. GbtcB8]
MLNNTFSIAGKNYRQLAPLFLRLVIGLGFMAHGWAKLSRGPAGFEKLLSQIGVPFPHMMAWLSILTELLGGLAIFLGLFVSIAAIPLIVTMLVAMFTIHIHYGFSSVKTIGLTPQGPVFGPPGYEINLVYIAGLVSLVITGAGVLSVDAWLVKRKTRSVD